MTRITLGLVLLVAGLAALALFLFAFKAAFILAVAAALCLGGVAVLAWLSFKRMRSTPQTRPPATT